MAGSGEEASASAAQGMAEAEAGGSGIRPEGERPAEAGTPPRVLADSEVAGQWEPGARVRCTSKHSVAKVLEMCSLISRTLLENQPQLPEARRERALRDLSGNFETAVQENVSIYGQLWQEVSECPTASDINILEDQLDEIIVDTATKRDQCPRKILGEVVKAMKIERDMLDVYKPVVNPQELRLDPAQMSPMVDLTTATAATSKQIGETMKSLPALIEKAEGFSQVLNWQPHLELCRIHAEVFPDRKTDTETKNIMRKVESTPRETEGQKESDCVLYKKRKMEDSPQHRLYPLRSKRKIHLNT
uniref:Kinetochore-associated protein NSL1 homolog n=1 Tax=Geotrypetes seraphini TaxID=260995 RepID=A0A6P8R6T4_GEOSA|nr:kinetochore-associated protein NSL1 homolog [Geotrypetes seraphini]